MRVPDVLRALWRTLRRRREEVEIDEEIRFHLDMKTRELVNSGMPIAEARRAARRAFGGPLAVREFTHESFSLPWLESFWLDTKFALRTTIKRPAFSAVIILTLAVGIGANTAVFGLLHPLLVETPPMAEPGSVFLLGSRVGDGTMRTSVRDTTFLSYPFYRELKADLERAEMGVKNLAVYSSFANRAYLTSDDASLVPLEGRLVSGSFFEVLGLTPSAGRFFDVDDDAPDREPAVVLGYTFARRHFGTPGDAVGRSLRLNGASYWVAGVAPDGFRGVSAGENTEIWFHVLDQARVMGELSIEPPRLSDANAQWLRSLARLDLGEDAESVRASLETVFIQRIRDHTGSEELSEEQLALLDKRPVSLVPVGEAFSMLRYEYERPLKLLMAIVAALLLVSCANVGNLLLLRNAARQRELSARLVLGAGSFRLALQVLTECFVLAAMGGVLAILLSSIARSLLVRFILAGRSHVHLDTGTDWTLLGFTALVATGAVLLFGLIPVARLSKFRATGLVHASSESKGNSSWGGGRLSQGLVIAQVAISLALLSVSGLFVQSLRNITGIDAGFAPEQVIVAKLDPVGAGLSVAELMPRHAALRERVEAIPGVRSASLSLYGMFTGNRWVTSLDLREGELAEGESRTVIQVVDGRFFETIGIPLYRGRVFTDADSSRSPPVAVVNERFARTFFPDGNVLGEQFDWGEDEQGQLIMVSIVGVVADVKLHDLRERSMPVVYLPARQGDNHLESLEVRASGNVDELSRAITAALHNIVPRLPVREVVPMTQQMDRAIRRERLIERLTMVFSLLCAFLTAVGIYGLLGYVVGTRTKEIGLRMAVGATRGDVVSMVIEKGFRLVGLGILLGLALSVAASRSISSFVYGVASWDVATLALASFGLVIISLVAMSIPARRAAGCDPTTALRWN